MLLLFFWFVMVGLFWNWVQCTLFMLLHIFHLFFATSTTSAFMPVSDYWLRIKLEMNVVCSELLQATTKYIKFFKGPQRTLVLCSLLRLFKPENKTYIIKILKGVCYHGKSLYCESLYWTCLGGKAGFQLYLVALFAGRVISQNWKWFKVCW